MYCVYIHRNKINNKIYVGLTRQSPELRWRKNGEGYKGQEKFWRAITKYGWENFEHLIIQYGLIEDEAYDLEAKLIQLYDSVNNGYNTSFGGKTGFPTAIGNQKLRERMTGKKHTEATKKKISESKNNIKKSVICIETQTIYNSIVEASTATGIDGSSITKVCKGTQGIAGGFHWQYLGETPAPQRIDKRLKPVICLTTNKIYPSLTEAGRDTGVDISNIKKVCKGQYKTAGGLQWACFEGET